MTPPRRRWASFSIRDLILTTAIIGVVLGWWLEHQRLQELRESAELRVGQSVMKSTRRRFHSIDAVIEADNKHLLGKSLKEVCDLLDLNEVPWDEGYGGYHEMRIYHFPGFFLMLELELLPPGITPTSRQPYSFTDAGLKKDGVRWLASQYPALQADGVYDRKERMELYWKGVNDEFETLNREMQEKRRREGK